MRSSLHHGASPSEQRQTRFLSITGFSQLRALLLLCSPLACPDVPRPCPITLQGLGREGWEATPGTDTVATDFALRDKLFFVLGPKRGRPPCQSREQFQTQRTFSLSPLPPALNAKRQQQRNTPWCVLWAPLPHLRVCSCLPLSHQLPDCCSLLVSIALCLLRRFHVACHQRFLRVGRCRGRGRERVSGRLRAGLHLTTLRPRPQRKSRGGRSANRATQAPPNPTAFSVCVPSGV